MSETTRALCQIIERRPFLSLDDEELRVLLFVMRSYSGMRGPAHDVVLDRLSYEMACRAEFRRGQRLAYDQADFALRNTRPETDRPAAGSRHGDEEWTR